MTTVATSEVLNRAADLIEERGWAHGRGWTDGGTGEPLCVEGAIGAALGVGEEFTKVWGCPAAHAVKDYLGIELPLFLWNDKLRIDFWGAGGMAEAEVLAKRHVVEVLRAAAVIEAAREQKMAEVSA
jgi:hypothetical protein